MTSLEVEQAGTNERVMKPKLRTIFDLNVPFFVQCFCDKILVINEVPDVIAAAGGTVYNSST